MTLNDTVAVHSLLLVPGKQVQLLVDELPGGLDIPLSHNVSLFVSHQYPLVHTLHDVSCTARKCPILHEMCVCTVVLELEMLVVMFESIVTLV